MTHPVKLYGEKTRLIVRDVMAVGLLSSMYGDAGLRWYEADVLPDLLAYNAADAEKMANLLSFSCAKALRERGVEVDASKNGPAEPLDGCSMVAFYEPGRGVESARVTLTHIESGRSTIGYNRTHDAALRQANAAMAQLLKI